jgi:hypothetical protein
MVGWRKINVVLYLYKRGYGKISGADLASFRLEGGSNINQKGNTS